MNIHENTALLDAFVDGELTAEALSAVQAHLDTCLDCRAYVDDALAIRAAFPTEDDLPLPADFTKNVMATVAKAPQSRPKKQPWGKLAAAAACLAVIVLVQHGAGSNADTANSAVYAADQAVAEIAVRESVSLERSVEAPAAMEEADTASGGSSTAYTMDSAPAETQMENGTSAKKEDLTAESAPVNIPTVRLSVPELGDLLADFTPEETAPGYTLYLLTREEFDDLAVQLAERDIPLEVDDDTAAQIWVELLDE